MRNILDDLQNAIANGNSVAYTALVETRGSTPQKPGACMLVFADGSQSGTLGGGCVEAEVKRRALMLLDQGEPEIVSFQLDSDYGWDDGLICGGRMKMLIDPVRPDQDFEYFRCLRDAILTDSGCTEAVLLEDKDASQAASAARYLLDSAGQIIAHRASGAAPKSLAEHWIPLTERRRPYVTNGVSYIPHVPHLRLLIVGAGHVGQQVAELAAHVGFDVWVVDDRQEYCNQERFPTAKRVIVDPIDTALSGLDIDANTMCIIVTRGHNHDEEALYHLAETPARYVGMIGSRRKIKLIMDDLLREGLSRDALARVHAPLGFEIGSQTVPEIAVSIVAELIAYRNLDEPPARYRHKSVMEDIGATQAGTSGS
jgi:xanthine dehydrogenase accessory factor